MAVDDLYTVSLLNFDGNLTDQSGKIWTATNSATTSAAQSKFGGSSLYLNGTNQYISTPKTTDFEFGSNDFTIDLWYYCTRAFGSETDLFDTNRASYYEGISIYGVGTTIYGIATINGTSWITVSMTGVVLNSWNHVALIRHGTSLYLSLNGTLSSSSTISGTITTSGSSVVSIGAQLPASFYYQGYIDELRVSKGFARWTANFTPPTSAYNIILPSSLLAMTPSQYIPCSYSAASGAFGSFSGIGSTSGSILSATPGSTPNGYFNWIMVGYDTAGNKKFIPDRNLQSSISWDTLNSAGLCSNTGVPITIDGNSTAYSLKLLSGGIVSLDTSDEWDSIICNGVGYLPVDNVWNYSTASSWTSSTASTGDTNRSTRAGSTNYTTYTASASSTVSATIGFRPVLILSANSFIPLTVVYSMAGRNVSQLLATADYILKREVSNRIQTNSMLSRKKSISVGSAVKSKRVLFINSLDIVSLKRQLYHYISILSDTRISGSSTYTIYSDVKRLIGAQILNHYANAVRKVIKNSIVNMTSKRLISNHINNKHNSERRLYIPVNTESILNRISATRYYVLNSSNRKIYYGNGVSNSTIRPVSSPIIINSMTDRITHFLVSEIIYSNLTRIIGIDTIFNNNSKRILFIPTSSESNTKKQIYIPASSKVDTYRNVTGYYHPKIYGATKRLLSANVGNASMSYRGVSEIITSFHDIRRLISSTAALVNSGTLREVDYIEYVNILYIQLEIMRNLLNIIYIDPRIDIDMLIDKELHFNMDNNE